MSNYTDEEGNLVYPDIENSQEVLEALTPKGCKPRTDSVSQTKKLIEKVGGIPFKVDSKGIVNDSKKNGDSKKGLSFPICDNHGNILNRVENAIYAFKALGNDFKVNESFTIVYMIGRKKFYVLNKIVRLQRLSLIKRRFGFSSLSMDVMNQAISDMCFDYSDNPDGDPKFFNDLRETAIHYWKIYSKKNLADNSDHKTFAWDGIDRRNSLEFMITNPSPFKTLLALRTKNMYLTAIIARKFWPGTYFRYIWRLVGKQESGKSFYTKRLSGPASPFTGIFFHTESADIHVRDEKVWGENVEGMSVIELGEMNSSQGVRENNKVKRRGSAQVDHFRPSYGEKRLPFPRTCVLIGTGNPKLVLTDPTGSSRDIITEIEDFDLQLLDDSDYWMQLHFQTIYEDFVSKGYLSEDNLDILKDAYIDKIELSDELSQEKEILNKEEFTKVDDMFDSMESFLKSSNGKWTNHISIRKALERRVGDNFKLSQKDDDKIEPFMKSLGFSHHRSLRIGDNRPTNVYTRGWDQKPSRRPRKDEYFEDLLSSDEIPLGNYGIKS